MSAEQIERDGLSRIRARKRPRCGHSEHGWGCHKWAGWKTPAGPRCFTHTEPFRSDASLTDTIHRIAGGNAR